MATYTPHQVKYFAEQIMLRRPQYGVDALASAMSGVKVDLNPHQVDAALFALKSPLSSGALLADEVGLGKTIEAGLVLAQCWSERKRRILIIVPASLRTQWRAELFEKFYIESTILESKNYNKAKNDGALCPFDISNQVVICSYNFAAQKENDIHAIPWDLVIIDETHRLRNVYKSNNITGNKLKRALAGKRKLLLTATPLQNNLMELYGLVSLIDDHVFGDARTFRDMFSSVTNDELRNHKLKMRLQSICKRTLRQQVTEYVKYTSRHPILQEYAPTADEEKLYNCVSEYLQTDKLYALPQGQRTLITLVLRKLLASSSFAISGTLNSLIDRLQKLLDSCDAELDISDLDTFDQLSEEYDGDDNDEAADNGLAADRAAIAKELARLTEYAELAGRISSNAKGDNLLSALEQGFARTAELGGQRKAVIFTESRRTQDYLLRLLSDNGYEGQIVFLNGSNNDDISKRIYADWKKRHEDDGVISGSRQADLKAAMVEEFRDRASILIGTEAAAEGINLQFCSLVVNYDLPWNPQRIEQRIGRCHRYGQKNDVVVINFLNKKNAADVRVYELLDQKFRLFSGLFGSSDEVLGSIESGMDFEKRIAEIYQSCKTTDEIQHEFDELQEELSDRINEKMTAARQSILENFDDEVAARLKGCQQETLAGLDKFNRWLVQFFTMRGAERVQPLNQWRFAYCVNGKSETYNIQWKEAEQQGDTFLRRDDPLCQAWLEQVLNVPLTPAMIRFNNSGSAQHISFLDAHQNLCGVISVDRLTYEGFNTEEHLIISVVTEDGTEIDDEMLDRIMGLPAVVLGDESVDTESLAALRRDNLAKKKAEIERINMQYYIAECAKLDAYTEDLKDGLERELKNLDKEIKEKTRLFKASTDRPLAEMVEMQDGINALKKKRKKMRSEVYIQSDEIEAQNERLQDEIRSRMTGTSKMDNVMTISFEIV